MTFSFDWSGYTDVPPGMNLIFYPIQDANTTDQDYIGSPFTAQLQYDGGELSLPIGRYNVAIYNDYTYSIQFRNMDRFETAEGYLADSETQWLASRTRSRANRNSVSRAPVSRNVEEPDIFYVTQLRDFSVTGRDYGQTIDVRPDLATLTVDFHIKVTGINNLSQADGAIYGIANSVILSTGTSPDETPANHLFPFEIRGNELYARINVFLLKNKLTSTYELELAFLLRDNTISMGKYKFDITDQIREALEGNNGKIPPVGLEGETVIEVQIEEITIEDVETSGGFDASVDQWGEEVDINLK
jgi:hypothetical protein